MSDHDPARPSRFGRLGAWLGRLRRRRSPEETARLGLPAASRGGQLFSVTMFFLAGVLLTAFLLVDPLGLGWLSRAEPTGPPTATAGAESGPQLYHCPMHPEVLQDHPGSCPICKMDLVPVRPAATPEPAKSLYQCPMHPEVLQDHPGSCPICKMDLMPVKQQAGEPTASTAGVVTIDPVQVQNIGVVSRRARVGDIARVARTVGYLDFNADNIAWVNVKFSGWIEKVHVNYVGEEVRVGQPLFEIYSPELVTTQEEYLRALEYKAHLEESDRPEARRQAESLLRSSRQRLRLWDIGDEQVQELEHAGTVQRRLTIRSGVDGVVAEVMQEALEGMFVQAGMNLYKIAGLSTLWVHADVYESDMPWVRAGQPADISYASDPGRVFRGKVLFLYPEVSKETRTLKICVEVPNRGGRLRAGMYADVVVHGPVVKGAVLIPDAAVIRSGERNLVFVDLGEGRFAPRQIELGVRGEGGTVQVVRGLEGGEAVVTQAQFMLDSESRLQEAIAKFLSRGTATPQPAGHDHED